MHVIKPDSSKIQRFLLPPLGFSLVACFVVIVFTGIHIGALITCLIITLCVSLPFILFILPTFLFEKIIIETFTARFFFVFLFIRFKKVIQIEDILKITEQYRNNRNNGPKEIIIETKNDSILLSEAKYKDEDIKELILAFKEKNNHIKVTLLK